MVTSFINKALFCSSLGVFTVLFPSMSRSQSLADQLAALTRRAVSGDVGAQVELGASWIAGDYGRRDYTQAVHWFEASCKQDSPDGCAWLGSCKILARGIAPMPEEGIQLIEEAAASGSAVGMRIKADLISSGDWTKPNVGPSVTDLYMFAALRGDAIANDRVGLGFLGGRDRVKNLTKAAHFFHLSALLGNSNAQLHLGQMYESGAEFDDPMPESERAGRSSIEIAMSMYQKAAEKNNRIAQYRWASILRDGPSRERNLTRARALYEISALHQYGPARFALAQMLEAGQGGPADLPRALALFWDAATKNVPGAGDAALHLRAELSDASAATAEAKREQLRQFDGRFAK